MHGRGAVDRHIFPGPAIGVDQRRLAGDELALAAAEAAAATSAAAAGGGESHDAGDAVDAHHGEVLALRDSPALSARSCGMNSPSSPVSTVSRTARDLGEPQFACRNRSCRDKRAGPCLPPRATPFGGHDLWRRCRRSCRPGSDTETPFMRRAGDRVHVRVADQTVSLDGRARRHAHNQSEFRGVSSVRPSCWRGAPCGRALLVLLFLVDQLLLLGLPWRRGR